MCVLALFDNELIYSVEEDYYLLVLDKTQKLQRIIDTFKTFCLLHSRRTENAFIDFDGK